MSKRRPNPNLPIGELTPLKDALPPPEALVVPEQRTTKVTLLLSAASVRFFKQQATRSGTKYQKMIRTLVDRYAAHYAE